MPAHPPARCAGRRSMRPTDHHTVLRWSPEGLVPVADEPTGPLLAIDSWLVDEGAVRGYDLHWARFGGWCAELGVPEPVLARFRVAVTAALPRTGRGFPRVEARAAARRAAAAAAAGAAARARDPGGRRAARRRACPAALEGARPRLAAGAPRAGDGGRRRRAARLRRGRAARRGRLHEPAVVGGRGALHDARRAHAARRHARAAARDRAGARRPGARARAAAGGARGVRDVARRTRRTASAP